MPLEPGTRLGPYEITAPLGAGGMGEVYRAHDARLGRDVAVKILPADVFNDAARRQRFEQEARAIAALNHPNIIAIYDVGDGYIVSELVEGDSLRGATPGVRKTIDIGVQMAGGLAAAHEAGIVHRDLKPENVLLTRDGRVKILDFGLAKMTHVASGATETVTVGTEPGVVMGTVGYMSPEQVRGAAADHRTDIFSFGLILHELLAGRRAFQGETSVEIMTAILKRDAPELPESIPSGLRQIIGHCLEKDPGQRFQSTRDLGFALSQATTLTGKAAPLAAAPRLPKRAALVAVAVMLAAASVLAGHFLWRAPAPAAWSGVLLGGPEVAIGPSVSPDGHLIAFLALVDGTMQPGVLKPETGDWVILSHDRSQGYALNVSWSPDGARLYYDRTVEDVPHGIYSVGVLGGESHLVLENAQGPSALPDGSLLAVRLAGGGKRQLFRYWPATGRSREYPVIGRRSGDLLVKAFPDGRRAAVLGVATGAGRDLERHLFVLDLESGSLHGLPSPPFEEARYAAPGVSRDGRSVLMAVRAGNAGSVMSFPTDGGAPRQLFTLPQVTPVDAGPDGSVYVSHSERPAVLLRFPAEGGHAERIGSFPDADNWMAVLPDGRAVVSQYVAGRTRLMTVAPGKASTPLVDTSEVTSGPVTMVGRDRVAFHLGSGNSPSTIAVASVADSRIIARIPFSKGTLIGLAAAPDGKQLYAVADGAVWEVPVSGGEPRKIRAGDAVAVDPSGTHLLIEVVQSEKQHLFLVPRHGGPEREVTGTGDLRPAAFVVDGSLDAAGRALTPLATLGWNWVPGIVDLATGRFKVIPLDVDNDHHAMCWTPDGRIISLSFETHSTIWRFHQ